MKSLQIQGAQSTSNILIGENYQQFEKYLPKDKPVYVISDMKVMSIYGNAFQAYPIFTIGQGEAIKNLETVEQIIQFLLDNGAGRNAFVLAVGGGIVSDVAGFAASVFMRGVSFGFISTTLLSQVDASVGGKNGVNFGGLKNMVGVFNQPEFVLCDPNMLKTLHKDDLNCGFAEIVKHTLIADPNMFFWLEENGEKALSLEENSINALLENSISIKTGVVNRDEKEQGERKKLNLGHTVGHAFEKVMKISHGNAVSLGLVVAAELSQRKGYLAEEDKIRIMKLLQGLGLPVELPSLSDEIMQALNFDKKRENHEVHFVLMHGIGNVQVERIALDELKQVLKDVM